MEEEHSGEDDVFGDMEKVTLGAVRDRLKELAKEGGELTGDEADVLQAYWALCAEEAKQVLRSGTAIGALVREAEHAESKADCAHKMNIAMKEANETQYWLDLLYQSEYIDRQSYESIGSDNEELLKLLVAIIKSSKEPRHVP